MNMRFRLLIAGIAGVFGFRVPTSKMLSRRPPADLPAGLPPRLPEEQLPVEMEAQPLDIASLLESLRIGQDVLIPTLTDAMETQDVTYSIKTDWHGPSKLYRQIWEASVLSEDAASAGRVPFLTLDWTKDKTSGLEVGVARNLKKQSVFLIRRIQKEPSGNLEWKRPSGCGKNKPPSKTIFCVQPPDAGTSDPCLFTIIKSSVGDHMFVFKKEETGQDMILQSSCSAYTKKPEICSFHAAACPGKKDEKKNPLGYDGNDYLAGAHYYQQSSDVWMSEEGGDIALYLTLSSIAIHLNLIEPNEANTAAENATVIKMKEQEEAAPTFPADDIAVDAFVRRLVEPSWLLGGAEDALVPKMVMHPDMEFLQYSVRRLQHGRLDWLVTVGIDEQQSKPIVFANLDWDRTTKPKKMVVHTPRGQAIWIKQSGEPKGSPKWRRPEGCKSKSRPRASSNRLFCVVPAGSDAASPCMFTFQKSKYGNSFFVFHGEDMVYQMNCVYNDFRFCYFSKQQCPGYKYAGATLATLEMNAIGSIVLSVHPYQDTGLFMAIASMILHKDA